MLGLSAPTVMEKVPALQLMHSAEPDASLNLPTSQAEQFPPSGPVKPLLQVQLLTDMLPEADHAFDGHAKHCAEPDASLNNGRISRAASKGADKIDFVCG